MMFGMILFWGVLIALAILGVGLLFPSRDRPQGSVPGQNPLDILAQRYARGDLSPEQYKVIKQDIGRIEEKGKV